MGSVHASASLATGQWEGCTWVGLGGAAGGGLAWAQLEEEAKAEVGRTCGPLSL